ncbi:efflux RND transporter periplasmic adaptor subunit [Flavitalea antarctica]
MKSIIIFLFFGAVLVGCRNKYESPVDGENAAKYTCPMHLSVQRSSPGLCPVCKMSMVKIESKKNDHAEHAGNYITVEKRQQRLAGVETDTVKFRSIVPTSTILGTVAIDEEQVTTISSRVKGRIDKLYVKTTGEYLRRGNPVYGIYSEELFAGEKEFITLSEKKQQSNTPNSLLDDMLAASKNRLLLWGLSENQISELEKNKAASPFNTFYSQTEGYVIQLTIKEGMYVSEGTPLIKSAGLKQVWVEAQVYTNETNYNSSFQVYFETSPDEIYSGRLVFHNPRIEEGRKIQLLRIKVNNTKNKLIPGMMVYVNPTKNQHSVLSVPKTAVLLEKMKTVWVQKNETTFEQRMVKTGIENKYFIEILSGIKLGEIIVTSGAYLISSEFILKSGAGQRHDH